jgi:predicted HicB family RNase H-like nuclease
MKLRPAMQLRFRDAEQYEKIKAAAAEAEISVNEYILCGIEYAMEQAAKAVKQFDAVQK